MEKQGVNLRLFEGVEWKDLDVKRAFWSRSEPKYVCPEGAEDVEVGKWGA